MRNARRLGLLLILVCAASCGRGGWKGWVEVEAPDGSFTVHMPGVPAATDRNVESAVGPVPTHLQVHQGTEHAFIVGYTEYPPAFRSQVSVDELLDGARDGSIDRVHGTLVSEAPLKLAGHPGREVRIQAAEGRALVQARFYVVESRLYQQLATTAPERASGAEVAEFMDSFTLRPAR